MKKYRKYYLYLIVVLILTALFQLLRPSRPVMNAVTSIFMPVKRLLAVICSVIPFSVGELLVCASIAFLIFFIIRSVYVIVKSEKRFTRLFRRLAGLTCAAFTVYLGLCLMLGSTYYANGFQDKSGIRAEGGTVDELYELTRMFALKASETGALVPRDENGLFNMPLNSIIDNSIGVYDGVEKKFPFLAARDLKPKKVFFSRLMSYFNYTGFYFPFTGEANINTDCPRCLIPATIAHEMAHQRGIAAEQEANFVAIVACITSGKAEYEYSGWLFGYIYLVNALYSRDYDRFCEVYSLLTDEVMADITANNEYWAQFETPISDISDKVYDDFLKGYGQEMGVQSYGAVVDLLLSYYR